jgi:hypothetical protein
MWGRDEATSSSCTVHPGHVAPRSVCTHMHPHVHPHPPPTSTVTRLPHRRLRTPPPPPKTQKLLRQTLPEAERHGTRVIFRQVGGLGGMHAGCLGLLMPGCASVSACHQRHHYPPPPPPPPPPTPPPPPHPHHHHHHPQHAHMAWPEARRHMLVTAAPPTPPPPHRALPWCLRTCSEWPPAQRQPSSSSATRAAQQTRRMHRA